MAFEEMMAGMLGFLPSYRVLSYIIEVVERGEGITVKVQYEQGFLTRNVNVNRNNHESCLYKLITLYIW